MENMRKVRKTMMKVLGYLIIFLFMMMTAVGSYQIITRYFFNRPSTVSEELLTYSFTWMSLLASAYVFGKRDHMRMGFMADKLVQYQKQSCSQSVLLCSSGMRLLHMQPVQKK